jgi:hypothetical protein
MFLSKIWFVLVGLLAGIGLTAAFVAPRPADRRIEQLEGQRLDRAQYAAEQMLKTDAHRWIDYVAKLGRDAVIAESLDSASRGVGEARLLHETVKSRLKVLVPDLAGIGVETLVAVDAKGRVVARTGEQEGEFGDSIAGAEVVGDALRGVLSDDVWGARGKLRRIAAAPVLAKTRDRIVGAIYVGAETGKRLAELWKKNLGVEVAILLKKQVLASTISDAMLTELPNLIESHKPEMAEAKRTRALPLPVGSDKLLVVGAPFIGQASEQDAYYVLMGKKAAASNPWALLSSTTAEDLKWDNFPWLPLAGGLIGILAIGLFLQRYEVEGPLVRLRKELRRLGDGDLHRIDDTRFHGKFGGIARDVSAAIERFTHAPQRSDASRSDISRKDFNAILDSGAPVELSQPAFTPPPPAYAPPPAFPAFAPPPPSPFGGAPAGAPPPADPWKSAPPPAPMAAPPPPIASPPPPASYASFDRGGAPGGDSLAHAPSPRLVSPAPPPAPPATPLRTAAPPPPAAFPRPSVANLASVSDPVFSTPAIEEDSPPRRRPFAAEIEDETTSQLPSEESTRMVDKVDAEEAHIREVFADYVSARRETGEPTATLTLDKFRAKLEANRLQLISKYSCRTARFSVYIKDGKAAIKATPVRE